MSFENNYPNSSPGGGNYQPPNYQPGYDPYDNPYNNYQNGYNNPQAQLEPYQPSEPFQPSEEPLDPEPVPPKKKKGLSFLRRLEILAVIIILLVATFFAIIVITPDSQFSQTIIKNTFLNRIINPQGAQEEDTDKAQVVADKEDSDLNGTNQEADPENIPPFEFAEPGEAKTTVEVVDDVLPSVLSISVQEPNNGGLRGQNLVSGTGFIVNQEGLVVTNKHVISPQCQFGSNVEMIASNQAQEIYKLKLLSVDPIYDIALLQIQNPPQNLIPVSFTDSDDVKLGSEVIAIGNALGELQNTVTQGIISGLSRSLDTDLVDECTDSIVFADGLIQTDAAINQGNSGGPLFDASGQLIGMNTFGTQGAENVGLAIPSNIVVSALNSYRQNGIVERPKLGIYSRSITPLIQDEESWLPTDYGEIVIGPNGQNAVERNSAADEAGLEEGDIILEINDIKIEATRNNPSPLRRALLSFQPEDKISLTVLKASGTRLEGFDYESETVELTATLGTIVFEI